MRSKKATGVFKGTWTDHDRIFKEHSSVGMKALLQFCGEGIFQPNSRARASVFSTRSPRTLKSKEHPMKLSCKKKT